MSLTSSIKEIAELYQAALEAKAKEKEMALPKSYCSACGADYSDPLHSCATYPGLLGSANPTPDVFSAIESSKTYLYDAVWARFDEQDKKIEALTRTLIDLLNALREVQCR